MPTPEALLGMIIFGAIGMGAFVYGKKSGMIKPMLTGIALIVYPYFVSATWLVFLIGLLLTGSLFLFRD